jgi:cobyrinic acid a,c-diamide synthase
MKAPRLLIASPSSGSGKTTITVGIMAALSSNKIVQGFKVGPDYIDPNYHTVATGRISRNIDTWMLPTDQVERIFCRGQQGADISIIEGVMGLFDGFNGKTERGSSAEVAKLLNTPVILVIDVRAMARSAGAVAYGFNNFDPAIKVAGIIANRAGSPKHTQFVIQAIEKIGLPIIGCIPRDKSLNVPERHLGLFTAGEREAATNKFIQEAKKAVLDNLNMDTLISIAQNAANLDISIPKNPQANGEKIRIAVARDKAFCFYYQDNFDLLESVGAEIIFFSPLRDKKLPENIAGLYLGGGYPELYATEITENTCIRTAIHEAIASGLPTYAECGGLMMLTNHFVDSERNKHQMIGALPGYAQMTDQLKMGYREVVSLKDTVILPRGETIRGHEFHYSEWAREEEVDSHAYAVKSRTGSIERLDGFAKGNLLASYVHIHFASNPDIATNFVNKCKFWQTKRAGK